MKGISWTGEKPALDRSSMDLNAELAVLETLGKSEKSKKKKSLREHLLTVFFVFLGILVIILLTLVILFVFLPNVKRIIFGPLF